VTRFYIDCRGYSVDLKRSIALFADTKEELLQAVVQHGTTFHGFEDTSEFTKNIVKEFKERTHPI
jgi:predicted small metal-binding protein